MEQEKKIENPTPEQPATQPAGTDDVEKAKGMAWLSYLWILWLVPLLTMKDNSFAKFHVKQGIVITIYWVGLWIVSLILSVIFIGPVIGTIGSIILVIFCIIGIVQSLGGKYWKCPLGVHQLAEKFKF